MADTVQTVLERMLPELDSLEKQGLFTREEIKEIVRRRTAFEYRLRRRGSAAIKDDYMRYIEYEMQLEALRQLRRRDPIRRQHPLRVRFVPRGPYIHVLPPIRFPRANFSSLSLSFRAQAFRQRADGVLRRKGKQGSREWYRRQRAAERASDVAVIKRVLFIFSRATRRFKGDLDLWMRYLDFCKASGSRKQMQKTMARALQLHPTEPSLWLYAASYEFTHRMNAPAARTLLQRGLRMCCPQLSAGGNGGSERGGGGKGARGDGGSGGGAGFAGKGPKGGAGVERAGVTISEAGNISIVPARVLEASRLLWSEYLRMELVHARKLKARQLLLGIETEEGGGEKGEGGGGKEGEGGEGVGGGEGEGMEQEGEGKEGNEEEEGEEVGMGDGKGDGKGDGSEGKGGSSKPVSSDELAVQVATVVCRTAIKSNPKDLLLHVALLEALRLGGGQAEAEAAEEEEAEQEEGEEEGGREGEGKQRQENGQEEGGAEEEKGEGGAKAANTEGGQGAEQGEGAGGKAGRARRRVVELKGLDAVEEEVCGSMAADFPDSATALEVLARRCLRRSCRGAGTGAEAEQAALKVFEDALEKQKQQQLSSFSPLCCAYLDFLMRLITGGKAYGEEGEGGEGGEDGEGETGEQEPMECEGAEGEREGERDGLPLADLVCRANAALSLAEARGLGSDESIVERHVALLLRAGRAGEALEAARKVLGAGGGVVMPGVWALGREAERRVLRGGGKQVEAAPSLSALQATVDSLVTAAATIASPSTSSSVPPPSPAAAAAAAAVAAAAAAAEKGSAAAVRSSEDPSAHARHLVAEVQCAALATAKRRFGISAARQLYARFFSLPFSSERLFLCAIHMEREWQAEHSGKGGDRTERGQGNGRGREGRVERLFDSALQRFSSSADLWLLYCQYALEVNDTGLLSTIHWKARHSLPDAAGFMTAYHRMVHLSSSA
ncbi:unnamed protein product [Closterium sp. Yama58-4]|nr:unnamed protein product [Closterium sp. Yama58-4]